MNLLKAATTNIEISKEMKKVSSESPNRSMNLSKNY